MRKYQEKIERRSRERKDLTEQHELIKREANYIHMLFIF